MFILPPSKESTSRKVEFVEPESLYTPSLEERYKSQVILDPIEGVEYIMLENIPILEEVYKKEDPDFIIVPPSYNPGGEETQEEKLNLSFQVNILAAEKLVEEILQYSPKIQLVKIPKPS